MKSLLSILFPTWVYWTGFLFTVAGLIYSIGRNMPWIACLALSPLIIASIHSAIRAIKLTEAKDLELQGELELRKGAEQKLSGLSSDWLMQIDGMLQRGSFEQFYDSIHFVASYIGRLQSLTIAEFNIRELFFAGEALYVAVKLPSEAIPQLRVDDPFMLYINRSGLNHPTARLRVHQINMNQSSIFLEVISEVDSTVVSSLKTLARTTGVKGLKDFLVSPAVSTEAFTNHDMCKVAKALFVLRDQLSKTD